MKQDKTFGQLLAGRRGASYRGSLNDSVVDYDDGMAYVVAARRVLPRAEAVALAHALLRGVA